MTKLYTKNVWQDEILGDEERYNILADDDTPIESTVQIVLDTAVAQAGTALDADKMNNIEEGIDAIDDRVDEMGVWQNWTPASQSGWTAMPTGTYKYCQVGKFVACQIAIASGTSNGTDAKIELPVIPSATSSVNRGAWGWAMDNGTQLSTVGGYLLATATNTINFFKTAVDGAAWTASGTKRIYCMFFYEAA